MSAFPAVTGYTNSVWTAMRGTLVYYQTNVNPSSIQDTESLAGIVADTMANGRDAINANDLYNGLTQAFVNLDPVITLPVTLDPVTYAFITSRITALQAAVLSLKTIPPTPLLPGLAIPAGNPAVPYPGLTEWMFNFSYETPPAGLTGDNFQAEAQAAATAWVTLATALQTQGIAYNGSTLNAINWMGSAAQQVANDLSNVTISDSYSATQAWNQLVALPSCTRYSENITNDPTSDASQQSAIIRYIGGQTYIQFNALQVSLQDATPANVQLTTVLIGDTLMDIAARTLGNYEQWYDIAKVNALQPPFISPTGGPNVAQPGDKLYLPTTTAPQTVTVQPSYTLNYLGVDLYYGPLNQPMLPWGGDFQTIAGYDNLSISLGRRLQTTLESLIYHNTYGSRVPPEIGQPISQSTSGYLTAYAQSALLSDPRVNSLISITTTLQANYVISINAVVLPNGYGVSSVNVNEVLQPG
jgi:nucleoid-associated protein YgaU/phage baseplate assembly protein W